MTWVQSLGGEDLLEKEMATHSSILTWRIPRTGEPGELQSMGLQRVRLTEQLTHTHTHIIIANNSAADLGSKRREKDKLARRDRGHLIQSWESGHLCGAIRGTTQCWVFSQYVCTHCYSGTEDREEKAEEAVFYDN